MFCFLRLGRSKLSNNVRNQEILELGDLILEAQLALLDPGDLELIDSRSSEKRIDRGLEVAMLLAEQFDSTVDNFAVQTTRSRASYRLRDASGRRCSSSTPSHEKCTFSVRRDELW